MEENIIMFLLRLRKQGVSPATLVRYRGRLLRCAHFLRYCPVEEIVQDEIANYVACLRVQFAPRTVRRHLRALDRFFGWCVEEGILAENPASML